MQDCKDVKHKIKLLKAQGTTRDSISMSKALDHLQYSLKVINNSLYGCMAFKAYNMYIPRCGMAVTGCGRWALNVASVIAGMIGFITVYGDTDSIM